MENAGRQAALLVEHLFPGGRVAALVGSGTTGVMRWVSLRALAAWGPRRNRSRRGNAPLLRPGHAWLGVAPLRIRSRAARRDRGADADSRAGGGRCGRPAGYRNPRSAKGETFGGDPRRQRSAGRGRLARHAFGRRRHQWTRAWDGGAGGRDRGLRVAEAGHPPLPGTGVERQDRGRRDRVSARRDGEVGPPGHARVGVGGVAPPARRNPQERCRRAGDRGWIGDARCGDPGCAVRLPVWRGTGAVVCFGGGQGGDGRHPRGAVRGCRRRPCAQGRGGAERRGRHRTGTRNRRRGASAVGACRACEGFAAGRDGRGCADPPGRGSVRRTRGVRGTGNRCHSPPGRDGPPGAVHRGGGAGRPDRRGPGASRRLEAW